MKKTVEKSTVLFLQGGGLYIGGENERNQE
jgi:hypothetical protein